jgi:ribosomal protein S18 acetylase RimI-like enzyme
MTDLVVRYARDADMVEIQALLRETWHATYDPIYGREEVEAVSQRWHALDVLAAQVREPKARFIVAVQGGVIAGTASARDVGDGVVSLGRLYVRPQFQGRGIGARLFKDVLADFTDACVVTLEVAPANVGAIRFYERRGFSMAARKPTAIRADGGDDALIMTWIAPGHQ